MRYFRVFLLLNLIGMGVLTSSLIVDYPIDGAIIGFILFYILIVDLTGL